MDELEQLAAQAEAVAARVNPEYTLLAARLLAEDGDVDPAVNAQVLRWEAAVARIKQAADAAIDPASACEEAPLRRPSPAA